MFNTTPGKDLTLENPETGGGYGHKYGCNMSKRNRSTDRIEEHTRTVAESDVSSLPGNAGYANTRKVNEIWTLQFVGSTLLSRE